MPPQAIQRADLGPPIHRIRERFVFRRFECLEAARQPARLAAFPAHHRQLLDGRLVE
jgi:hypothetical protein